MLTVSQPQKRLGLGMWLSGKANLLAGSRLNIKAERRQAIRQIRSLDRKDTEQNVRDACMRKSLRFQLHPKEKRWEG